MCKIIHTIPQENKDEVKTGKHTNPRQNHYESWEREKIESGDFIKVNKKDKSFAIYKKKLLQFKLPVSKVLGHMRCYKNEIEEEERDGP